MGSSYLGEDERGEYCENCYGRPGDVSAKTHADALATVAAARARIAALEEANRCRACDGGKSPDAHACVCGGSGLASDAVGCLRSELAFQRNEADLKRIVLDLAMGVRMLKAYPKSRDKRIDALVDYLHRNGLQGEILRAAAPRRAEGD